MNLRRDWISSRNAESARPSPSQTSCWPAMVILVHMCFPLAAIFLLPQDRGFDWELSAHSPCPRNAQPGACSHAIPIFLLRRKITSYVTRP